MENLNNKLYEYAKSVARDEAGSDAFFTDCKIIRRILEEVEIIFPTERGLSFKINADWHLYKISADRALAAYEAQGNLELHEKVSAFAFWGYADWGHTSSSWEDVLSLGIYGLAERAFDYERSAEGDEVEFYSALGDVWRSVIEFVKRAARVAVSCGRERLAKAFQSLCERAPESLYEALVTILLYYNLHQEIECTPLRTVGRLDSLLYPFFEGCSEDEARELLVVFMKDLDAIRFSANVPFAVCGTDGEGKSSANRLTPIILEAFGEVSSPNVKLHFLVARDTPRELILRAFELIRGGYNSIVFLSDETVISSLLRIGIKEEDARAYHVVGCYECLGDGEIGSTCGAKVNIPKALEYALFDGFDILLGRQVGLKSERRIDSFDALFLEFERQLTYIVDSAIRVSDDCERDFAKIHSSPIYTTASSDAISRGKDVFAGGARYKNSSLNAIGLATAADSLAAIKKMVFDERKITLPELSEVLKNNWQGDELLRLYAERKCPKYGRGDATVDKMARRIVDLLDREVNGRKNTSGGVHRLGLFSIDWRWEWGAHTAASADGRLLGNPLSQNSSASFGSDSNGASAHLISAASLGGERVPNGSVVDVDLHSSALSGDDGLLAAAASLRAYFAEGGFAVHYNVLDSKALTDAKANPEKYPNLQVRLCGWNVRFSRLSEKEQNELIARAER